MGYGIQIFAAVFSILTNLVSDVALAKHSPPEGAGKVYAFKSFFGGIFGIGYGYFSNWLIDQHYSRLIFVVVTGLSLSMTAMFVGIGMCCKGIAQKPTDRKSVV